jgi:hypothetical protein
LTSFDLFDTFKVNAFGDSEAALIKFSNHSEAKAAYTCPDAVLGNRFIRVFWHQPDRENKPVRISDIHTFFCCKISLCN